jgi:hypothetical protein
MSSYVGRYNYKADAASRLVRFAAWDTEYTEAHKYYLSAFIHVIRALRILIINASKQRRL